MRTPYATRRLRLTDADRAAWADYEAKNDRAARAYRDRDLSVVNTDPAAREMHRRYRHGERTPEVIDGERRYQRDRKRQQRREVS